MKKLGIVLLIASVLIFGTSCGVMQPASVTVNEGGVGEKPATATISADDDLKAKKVISEYFTALYSDTSVDSYNEYSRTGIIPDNIRGYIADKTIKEGDGNPEVGIHLPRYVSVNGMTIIGYNVEILKSGNGEDTPNIVSEFVSKNGDNYLYFTKVYCKAKAIPDDVFSSSYRKNEDNTYTKMRDIGPENIDLMRVEIRYDVELTKSDVGFSILRATESNIKPGMKNRLFVFNNDNITRLSYLDLTKNDDGSYRNPSDGEIYETEKAVVTKFFSRFTELDRERMNLLSYRWKQGTKQVSEFLNVLGVTTDEEGVKLIELNDNYGENYPLNSFPLRNNMERIVEIKNFTVTPHPAYSDKIKLYYVNFDATVQRTNGITDEYFTYRYDYIVSLAKAENSVYIEKFRLNEYYNVSN
ncbi:hypothetical protein ODU73_001259 [Thermoclostridium stercorarium]|uniref:hypothetical protein n=1 Tax=Thermoclostridium stercorarium TaxID=1510 RepID=UPI002248D526|nr:hypothetical protein [Thermoclostridium stercorarium]UZQ86776.1 hypothetical protein ODU73_001259 [Thermoclostridium stercorarium]